MTSRCPHTAQVQGVPATRQVSTKRLPQTQVTTIASCTTTPIDAMIAILETVSKTIDLIEKIGPEVVTPRALSILPIDKLKENE